MKDLSGKRIGHLTVISPTNGRKGNRVIWKCQCDCGNVVYKDSLSLIRGRPLSCGCQTEAILSQKSKEEWEDRAQDLGMQDNTNVSFIMSDTVFVTNTTGARGVQRDGKGGYYARLRFQKKEYRKCGFKTVEEAKRARDEMYDEIVIPYLKSIGKA